MHTCTFILQQYLGAFNPQYFQKYILLLEPLYWDPKDTYVSLDGRLRVYGSFIQIRLHTPYSHLLYRANLTPIQSNHQYRHKVWNEEQLLFNWRISSQYKYLKKFWFRKILVSIQNFFSQCTQYAYLKLQIFLDLSIYSKIVYYKGYM